MVQKLFKGGEITFVIKFSMFKFLHLDKKKHFLTFKCILGPYMKLT